MTPDEVRRAALDELIARFQERIAQRKDEEPTREPEPKRSVVS